MAQSLTWPLWLTLWVVISGFVVLWDAGFVFNRPASMEGGELFWIWSPYPNYYKTDRSYADMENVFTVAQSWGNIIEVALSFVALGMSWSAKPKVLAESAMLIVIVSTMTFWKTCIYWIQEACAGWANTNNNEIYDLVVYVAIPTSFWFIFPYLAMCWGVRSVTTAIAGQQTTTVNKPKNL